MCLSVSLRVAPSRFVFVSLRVAPSRCVSRSPFTPTNKKTVSGLFVFVLLPRLSTNELWKTFAEPACGSFTGEMSPDPLPCDGLLFLLVTKRSPRTGSPRGARSSGGTLGRKGMHLRTLIFVRRRHDRAERTADTLIASMRVAAVLPTDW